MSLQKNKQTKNQEAKKPRTNKNQVTRIKQNWRDFQLWNIAVLISWGNRQLCRLHCQESRAGLISQFDQDKWVRYVIRLRICRLQDTGIEPATLVDDHAALEQQLSSFAG